MSDVMDLLHEQLDEKSIREIANYIGADESQTRSAIAASIPTILGGVVRYAETEQGAAQLTKQIDGIGGASIGDILGELLGAPSRPPTPGRPQRAPANDDILPPTGNAAPPRYNQRGESDIFADLPKPSGNSPLDRSLGPGNELPSHPKSARVPEAPRSPRPGQMPDILGDVFGNKQKKVEDAIGKSSGLDLKKIGPLLAILAPIVLSAMRAKASSASASKGGGGFNPGDLSDFARRERRSVEAKTGGSLLGKLLDQDGDGDFDLSDMLKLGFGFLSGRR
ncbi:MAG: DUF937 domain-containing protein [Planctomycetes bacterium]|nr:DUF937 domain-containing protein [Planctomycetota bacterium]